MVALYWTHFGPFSPMLARTIRPQRPPLLVMGLGRSGTSWMGDVLGSAPNAMYLREPITASILAAAKDRDGKGWAFDDPEVLSLWGDRAFEGFPVFTGRIVRYPPQWALSKRHSRRLVIKEVNVLMTKILLDRYRPRMIYLMRHPAGVALSASRLGLGPAFFKGDILGSRTLREEALKSHWEYLMSLEDPWEIEGARQAAATLVSMPAVENYRDKRLIFYEELCEAPVRIFRELAEFANLEWDTGMQNLVEEKSSGGDRDKPFETSRESRSLAHAWKSEIGESELQRLRKGYAALNLPFYRSDEEWKLQPCAAE